MLDAPIAAGLYRAGRALCPSCGAPLSLKGQSAAVRCDFCGGLAEVERRLRRAEPDVGSRHTLTLDWTPSHLLPGAESESATCWGCGAPLDVPGDQAVVRCAQCGSESKIERRLRALPLDVPVEADEQRATVELVERLERATDLAERVTLAQEAFEGWSHINRTLARRVGRLMDLMRGDVRLAHALGEAIGKLLCEGDVTLQNAVVREAQGRVLDLAGPRSLLWQLGLGKGLCLKPLLDAADKASAQGALAYAGAALWAARTLLERNYDEHPVLAGIILHRLLYLRGAALAWALRFVRGQEGLGYRYPPEELLRFIDDCAVERPDLVPELTRGLTETPLASESEYRARLDLLAELRSVAARAALLRTLPALPTGASLRLARAVVERVLAALDDVQLASAAAEALEHLTVDEVPAPIHSLVREQGDALPEVLRRVYLRRVPDTPHLSALAPLPYASPSAEEPAPELCQAEQQYQDGLSAAVDLFEREAAALRQYVEVLSGRTSLMLAAGRNETGLLDELLASGADVDEQNQAGRTALMFAAEAGAAGAVQLLRTRGADGERRSSDGKTALTLAAEAGQIVTLELLLDTTPEQRQEAFRAAFLARQVGSVRRLLEAGVDPDTLEEGQRTPLIIAVREGHAELAQALVAAGALTDHRDAEGQSARDYASLPLLSLLERAPA
jgi:hypothetical protein